MNRTEKKKGMNPKYIQFFVIAVVFFGFMYFIPTPGGNSPKGDAIHAVYSFSGDTDFLFFNSGVIVANMQGIVTIDWGLAFREDITAADINYGLFFYDEYGERRYISEHERNVRDDEMTRSIGIHNSLWLDQIDVSLAYLVDSLHAYVNIAFADGTNYDTVYHFSVRDVLSP